MIRTFNFPRQVVLLIAVALLWARAATPQSTAEQLQPILTQKLQTPQVVAYQLEQYLLQRAPQLPSPSSATEWTTQAEEIRKRVLDVIYHGWPREWVNSPPHFIDRGTIPSGKGYRIRKFQYEIVPGFYSTALLYEPEHLSGKVPAVLDVMGHFPVGKSEEFEQKLCINQALRGMIALNLEWLNMGELKSIENDHWYGAHLDLAGLSGVGLFYLAMRRGLDYLAQDPQVDPARIGVTGLSGGGWQTITLSALDPRVEAADPVAGFTSLIGRAERQPDEPGDFEQNESDLLVGQDYSTFVAMRAPRPTLITTNAEDDCCFRGPLVQPEIYDPVLPFFRLFDKESQLQFHINTDISAHNYGLDDRQRAYRFFDESFGLKASEQEIPVGSDIKTYDELAVGLPKEELTILALARKMAGEISREPVPSGEAARKMWATVQRDNLRNIARYHPVQVERPWRVANTTHNQLASLAYRFQMSNGLSATGVWLKAFNVPDNAPLTIVLNDAGMAKEIPKDWEDIPRVAHLIDRDHQVLVLDLLFVGQTSPGDNDDIVHFAEMLEAAGDRPVGLEAGQLIGIAQWATKELHPQSVSLQTKGLRSQVVALVAGAIEPQLFSQITTREGIPSFSFLYQKPVSFLTAPEPFCLDLYKDFDLDRLAILAEPAKVLQSDFLELKSEETKK